MTAAERIKERLEEVDKIRNGRTSEIVNQFTVLKAAKDHAQEVIRNTEGRPDQLHNRAVAKVQLEEAEKQIAELKSMYRFCKQETLTGSQQETKTLFKKLKRETVTAYLTLAERALQLRQELFSIGKAAIAISDQECSMIDRWAHCVDASLSGDEWRYRCMASVLFRNLVYQDDSSAFEAILFNGGKVTDHEAEKWQKEIEWLREKLAEMN